MEDFRKKKKFGQHFLHDQNTAKKIANSLLNEGKLYHHVIEIGPGQGSLTQHLIKTLSSEIYLAEIDTELIPILKNKFPELSDRILNINFLKIELSKITHDQIGIIGNFPYNISSQILFKMIENRSQIPEMVGMFQKELAERVASKPGSKIYGGISVLVQAFYDIELLFKVGKHVFSPPPNVESAVIRLNRKGNDTLPCDESLFFSVVKQSFNQRRKTIRNSLKSFQDHYNHFDPFFLNQRPEQLSIEDFIKLTLQIQSSFKIL